MPSSLSNQTDMPVFQAGSNVQVDTHFHVFKAGQSMPKARYTPHYDASLGAWHLHARAAGVTHGVVVQTSFMGTDNRWLLAQLALHGSMLRGVAVVDPGADLPLLADLHLQGVRGIRLNLAGKPHDMAAWAGAAGLWDALLQLGWHLELHTDDGRLPDIIGALPAALPLVLDHFARPANASMHDASVLAVRQRRQRGGGAVHVKLSAPYRLAAGLNPAHLTQLWLHELGPKALLWGSDWPWTNHEGGADYLALYSALDGWLAGDAQLALGVRSVNPLRLYWPESSLAQSN
jgi:predicted TIM-barrel fold metal-dependent hydrolase